MSSASNSEPTIKRGHGSEERPVAKILWERDSRPEALALVDQGNVLPDNRKVDYRRYYDRDYFDVELEKLWRRSWLFACREEDIPQPGDRVPNIRFTLLSECGHWVMVEHRELFNRQCLDFLAEGRP
jgi:pimeloyl-ACP methyl ester carboxylesterase